MFNRQRHHLAIYFNNFLAVNKANGCAGTRTRRSQTNSTETKCCRTLGGVLGDGTFSSFPIDSNFMQIHLKTLRHFVLNFTNNLPNTIRLAGAECKTGKHVRCAILCTCACIMASRVQACDEEWERLSIRSDTTDFDVYENVHHYFLGGRRLLYYNDDISRSFSPSPPLSLTRCLFNNERCHRLHLSVSTVSISENSMQRPACVCVAEGSMPATHFRTHRKCYCIKIFFILN